MNGKKHHLGTFVTAEEAATAFARKYLAVHSAPSAQQPPAFVVEQFVDLGQCEIDDNGSWVSANLYKHKQRGHAVVWLSASDEYEGLDGQYTVEGGVLRDGDGAVIGMGQLQLQHTCHDGANRTPDTMQQLRSQQPQRPAKRPRKHQTREPLRNVLVGSAVRMPFNCRIRQVLADAYAVEIVAGDVRNISTHQLQQLCKQGEVLLNPCTLECGSTIKLWWAGTVSSLSGDYCTVQFDDGNFVEAAVAVVARHLFDQVEQSQGRKRAAYTTIQPTQDEQLCSICLSSTSTPSRAEHVPLSCYRRLAS